MRYGRAALAAGLLGALIAGPGASIVPPTAAQEQSPTDEMDVPLPEPRPDFEAEAEEAEVDATGEDASDAGNGDAAPDSIATEARIYQEACAAVLDGRVIASLLEPIETDEGCGLQSPWQVEAIAVNGRTIPLSGLPTMSCGMATALADWAEAADAGAQAILDSPIATLTTGPGYACRLRNNADEGFISEHGLGNAADISGFSLEDGRSITVLEDWDRESDAAAPRFLDYAHTRACTGFSTVLGPEANAEHEDHFHVDLGCHGQSCTARICE